MKDKNNSIIGVIIPVNFIIGLKNESQNIGIK